MLPWESVMQEGFFITSDLNFHFIFGSKLHHEVTVELINHWCDWFCDICCLFCRAGILIPLCESGTCTLREAIIIGSILTKCSIPVLHSR